MAKKNHKIRKHLSEIRREILRQMLTLSASGFGLVAALAWNSLIQAFVSDYIKPFIGGSSGIISLLVYAVLVTILAVIVTYNLTKLVEKS